MKILYIGDIMGSAGIEVVEAVLPRIQKQHQPDLVIAQAENVTNGRGINKKDYERLRTAGIDFFTGGNWSLHQHDMHAALDDPQAPIIRPANYPAGTAGKGNKEVFTSAGKVLVVSLLGQIVGRDADKPVDNPLQVIDAILENTKHVTYVARVVNFHGDFSSEKRVIGYYLDGKVTAVVGDHWHVPSADAMVLPAGTAHITDVGMCGSLHSSLGVKLEVVIKRWRDGQVNRNELSSEKPWQFNAVLIQSGDSSGLAKSIERLQVIVD